MLKNILWRLLAKCADASTRYRYSRGRVRALWGCTPILTLPLKAEADRALGFESDTLVFDSYHITNEFDYNARRLVNGARKIWRPFGGLVEGLLLVWVALRYDIIHYFMDRGTLSPLERFGVREEDLDFLRASGKRVYLFCYGADVRLREPTIALGPWNFCRDCEVPGRYCLCDSAKGRVLLDGMVAKCTAAVAMGDMLAYLPSARHMDYWPIKIAAVRPAPSTMPHGPLRIAHAPNHTHFKGTKYLETAIAKLRNEGHEIDYVKLQGVTNREVMSAFERADVVADQFLGGFYGYTALEAMALSKPVLVYIRSPQLVDHFRECPIINVDPESLEVALRWVLANRHALQAIGAQGRRYVERWHSVGAVATRLGRLYEDTGQFPDHILEKVQRQRSEQAKLWDEHQEEINWDHPFRLVPKFSIDEVLGKIALPIGNRWQLAGGMPPPEDTWHSYDRTPWRHPWMVGGNVRQFSEFSHVVMNELANELRGEGKSDRYAFVGNIANIGYMRALGMTRRGTNVDVILDPQDSYPFSQPFWEDFDGSINDLGTNPASVVMAAPLSEQFRRFSLCSDWVQEIRNYAPPFLQLEDLLRWPEFMPNLNQLHALQSYDALLVSQSLYFGYLSGRPSLIGPMGGDIWFDAARDDNLGRLVRRSLGEAYAVLVSNPITLAHARRYGLKNLIYMPLMIDETRYCPGDGSDVRGEWNARVGGSFFVLTSMRLDNAWKGASTALEGFIEFAKHTPEARLVVLGWGKDLKEAMKGFVDAGIEGQVLLLPAVGKARLAKYLRAADAFMEQFLLGYYGASGLEAMSSGLPVIMRIERTQYEELHPTGAPPILEAQSAMQVAQHLKMLCVDEKARRQIGEATRDWVLKTHASSAIYEKQCILLRAAARRVPIAWDQSPLSKPLTGPEYVYHRQQLANAPQFPIYEL